MKISSLRQPKLEGIIQCQIQTIIQQKKPFRKLISNRIEKNRHLRTYKNIRKIVTGQGGDYTNGCLLDYLYLKK